MCHVCLNNIFQEILLFSTLVAINHCPNTFHTHCKLKLQWRRKIVPQYLRIFHHRKLSRDIFETSATVWAV